MATISRFNKFLDRDYSMKFHMPEMFSPNFEAWDSMLAGQQQKYNAAMAATQKYPKHLEWRGDLAGEYKKEVESKLDDITNSFINEGVRGGNRKMRDFAFELNQKWNPGGLAYELEKEYEEYAGGVKQITEYYEKNKAENSANRTYSLHKLKQDAQGEFKFNPDTGLYSRSGVVPNLIPYVDIADEAFKVAKEIKESGTTSIIARGPAWFEKIKRQGVTEETVREVTEALLEQPKYAQQIGVEKWLIDQNTTPEQKASMEEQAKGRVLQNKANVEKEITKLSTSTDEKDRKALQNQLKEAGYYKGPIDGDIGKDTENAIELYKQELGEKTAQNMGNVKYDNLVKNQMIDSYTRPLIKAFSREMIDKDLIYNRQWADSMKVRVGRQNTLDLVTAIQSLKNPEQSDYIVSPAIGTPMEALTNIKKKQEEIYNESEKGFNQVVKLSGIGNALGTTAPNKINDVANARTLSKDAEEFKQRMIKLGYNEDQGASAWDFFNSPAANDLQQSYLTMQDAKQMLDTTNKAEASMIENFAKTPTGKQEIQAAKNKMGFKGSDEEFTKLLAESRGKSRYEDYSFWDRIGGNRKEILKQQWKDMASDKFFSKMDNHYKNDPEAIPQSLRGYSFNALEGAGGDLRKLVFDDFKAKHTVGYSSDGASGVKFKVVGTNDEVDDAEVTLDDVSFDVNASGVTYYMTGTSGKKKVSAVVQAPATHMPKLRQVAIDMKKEAKDGNDPGLDAVANNLYAVTTEGPRYQNAVEDNLALNTKNTKLLDNVIDIDNSFGETRRTFGTNPNIRGTEVGSPSFVDGNKYQKYKVYNPKTGRNAYMLTIEVETNDDKGNKILQQAPVRNSSGGLYYESSQEAESPIWDRRISSQIPVEINQQKVKQTNVTPELATQLMTGAATIIQQNSQDQDDD